MWSGPGTGSAAAQGPGRQGGANHGRRVTATAQLQLQRLLPIPQTPTMSTITQSALQSSYPCVAAETRLRYLR